MRQAARTSLGKPFTWRPRIFRSWAADQRHAAAVLGSARRLSTTDRAAVERWLRLASDWGFSAACKGVGDRPETVVEVYGPLELVPIAIIYPDGDRGFIFEQFDGNIQEATSIDAALAFVFL